MNSLSFLSRQFDVLASARTPPSTPSSETLPLLDGQDGYGTLKRVSTSATSLSSLSSSFASTSSDASGIPCLLRRVVIIRVFLSLWNYLYDGWKSLTRSSIWGRAVEAEVVVEEGSSDDEKDTEDEGKEESLLILDARSPPGVDPPIGPIVTPPPPGIQSPVTRASTVPIIPMEPSIFVTSTSSPGTSSSSLTITTFSHSASHPGELSRTPTPTSLQRKALLHRQKTLVLDLDETLIHSTSRPMPYSNGSSLLGSFGIGKKNKGSGYTVEVVLGGHSTVYHVYKRPFVDYFLRKVSAWYTLVIFTASMREYADPVIDWLDAGRGILERRFFRETAPRKAHDAVFFNHQSCTQLANGSYTKDLSIVEDDLSMVCLVDNSPICYTINEANGIPIEGWTHDPHDEALLDLLPFLDSLRFTKDVRRVLGIRGFS
ncbi:Nuclear envelope morphology protein 1 [Steccherinum ochraceum]|uniref:Nuclear envelope morphology protein 1 n=1 Tax=Steccherinum ochraceum TaxID=92696 RepID=A0A4R0RP21_9APHY|nr:Nuclear envelope morphology protein 1 [Steccherinum ochraceum]